ncbi:MAG: heavy metal sensor histidine kinase [Thermodesulfobacteriota bacterium]|nr:heavy metal sensor histidine kinase [Thermodesulfobacteriota bacterium]
MSSKGKIKFYNRIDVRLTIWYIFTFFVLTGMLFGFLDYRLRNNILKEIDRMLIDEAREIVNMTVEYPENLTYQLIAFEETLSQRKFYKIAFRVLNNKGKSLYSSPGIKGIIFPFSKAPLHLVSQKNFIHKSLKLPEKSSPFRMLTYYYEKDGTLQYIIQVATYLRPMKRTVLNFRRNLGTASFLAIFFGSVGGWFLSRRSLKPIDKITLTTRRITATSLSERLPLKGTGDELDRLAVTINQMIERLEESFQKLSRFTADAAHELRTPIAALKGETEVLLSKNRTLKEYKEALVYNLERLDFLTRLINDLLLLSKADKGKEVLQLEVVKLNEILKELWEAFNLVASQKNTIFTFNDSEEVLIKGDSVKLKQLFSNLMDNAIKYTPGGGKIDLSIKPATDKVNIILKDTGIGIPEDDLSYIFDRFYRVEKSRSRNLGGVGLGLSICSWIVKAHKGTIEVESRVNQGSTFTVTLPANLT